MVPQPVKAVIVLYPWPGQWQEAEVEEDERFKREGQTAIDPNVVWIKQTVTIAISLFDGTDLKCLLTWHTTLDWQRMRCNGGHPCFGKRRILVTFMKYFTNRIFRSNSVMQL